MRKCRAKINSINPSCFAIDNLNSSSAYLAISLSNPNFYGKRLRALLKLLDENFKNILILTSGYLYRHHFMILNNCNENTATAISMLEEEKYILQELSGCKHYFTKGNFTFSTWTEYYNTPEFQHSFQNIQAFYWNNLIFREEIYAASVSFLEKKRLRKMAQDKEKCFIHPKHIQNCINFFLEELAMFAYLVSHGFSIQIYPGSMLKVFNDITNGKFHDAPETLKSRVNVEVKFNNAGHKIKKI